MAAKRKYTKRSDYWEKIQKKNQPIENIMQASSKGEYEPQLIGDSFYNYESQAYSRSPVGGANTELRRNNIAVAPMLYRYSNIRAGMLPYQYSIDGVNVRDAIELCQKAYANIAVVRNAVDTMADFANSKLYLEGGSAKSRDFINAWFKKIKIWNLKDQFFREFYRSGNIFLYTLQSKIKADDFSKVRNLGINMMSNKIPVRYILLNPYDVVAQRATSFDKFGLYAKVLSEYEVERLRDPKTEEDRELYDALPENIKKRIKSDSWAVDGIKVRLDPEKLRYSFYKKQDYEPFAIPFAFPVLDDVNFKMEMKKIDQSICRTIENVVLLITMGTTPDNGGINPRNIRAMQALFQNQSVGRILVSDYTTKAEFVIPDINKVIGPAKYDVVNQDIKEGLQNIILSQEKFASTEVKAQMFLQRLKEARDTFLNEFLQDEIRQLCKNFGFRDIPTAKFETIDLKDQAQMQRVITRMMELGILPPEQGMQVIDTGVFPDSQTLEKAQEKFVDDRQKGFYNPLVGGNPMPMDFDQEEEIEEIRHPEGAKLLEQRRRYEERKNNRGKSPGRPGRPVGSKTLAETRYSVHAIKQTVDSTNDLYNALLSEAKKVFKKKRLNKNQKSILEKVCESVVIAKDPKDWLPTAKSCIENSAKLSDLQPLKEIVDISAEHELDDYAAAILHHSRKNSLEK
tara:strand:- start:4605 stop:6653 length:2049 start_codon:yes stop_codon:yes gene_type:complete